MKNMDEFLISDDYQFRMMTEGDLPEVLAIERSTYGFPWSETIFKDCLRVNYHCYTVEQKGVVKGYAIMSVAAGESHILNLCIDQSLRGYGVGRSMLAHLVEDARRNRADTMLLEVRASNEIAIDLYQKAGFNEIGRRNNYYPARGGREDALILMRAL